MVAVWSGDVDTVREILRTMREEDAETARKEDAGAGAAEGGSGKSRSAGGGGTGDVEHTPLVDRTNANGDTALHLAVRFLRLLCSSRPVSVSVSVSVSVTESV